MKQTGKARMDEKAIAALLTESTVSAAAKKAGMSTRTLQRRMRDPEFERQFREAKVRLIREATRRLTVNAGKAASILEKIFNSKTATSAARVSAAVNTLRLSLDAYELEELERRVSDLEKQTDAY